MMNTKEAATEIHTMNLKAHRRAWLVLFFAGLVGMVTQPTAASAVSPEIPQAAKTHRAVPTVLCGGITDNIIGNRPRMIQVTFIGFAIGVFILMTSTRKH